MNLTADAARRLSYEAQREQFPKLIDTINREIYDAINKGQFSTYVQDERLSGCYSLVERHYAARGFDYRAVTLDTAWIGWVLAEPASREELCARVREGGIAPDAAP